MPSVSCVRITHSPDRFNGTCSSYVRWPHHASSGRGRGVPAADESSTGKYEEQPQLLGWRDGLSQHNRTNYSDEERHATGIERRLVMGGGELQPACRAENIRCA